MVRSPSCTCPNKTRLYSLLGKKWNIFILEAISRGHDSFTEIRRDIGEANTKILTDRLTELIESEVIEKSETAGTYALTPLGAELAKKIRKLGEWWGMRK